MTTIRTMEDFVARLADLAAEETGAPPRLCAVRGCKTRAVPSSGTVCRKHKDFQKAGIRKPRKRARATSPGPGERM
jgi:hypothetical protein